MVGWMTLRVGDMVKQVLVTLYSTPYPPITNIVDIQPGKPRRLADGSEVDAELIAKVIRQMKKPVNGTVTLDEWAEYATIGKFELIAAFKRLTGIPPMTFHNAEKLEIAKRLLVFEKMSVTDVCFEIGFESIGSFVSKFSQCVGIPPGSYAREMCASGFAKAFVAAMLGGRHAIVSRGPYRKLAFERPVAFRRHSVIAALFTRPFPCRMPVAWRFVSPASSKTAIESDFDGYCLAASMPLFPKLAELVNFRPALIGREQMHAGGGEVCVRLRFPTVFDPPITLAVPALFCREEVAA
jgi:AraC-like DNA-binding protein